MKTIKSATDPRDFVFGASPDNPTQEVVWDTTLLPQVLDKRGFLVAVPPNLYKKCPIAHAFCNAMEMFLNEIGEASQLDRDYLSFNSESISLVKYVQAMRRTGMAAHAGDRPVKQVTRYERLNNSYLIDDLRVALFCNLLPVLSFKSTHEFGTDTYCATVVGVDMTEKQVVCASNKGYEFGVNGFFTLSFDYLMANALDAFVIREVTGIKTIVPEELYIRDRKRDTMALTTNHSQEKNGWRKMLDFFRGS